MHNVLVTGATGFLGKNLIELLNEKKINVVAYVLNNDQNIEWLKRKGVKSFIYEKDLNISDAVEIDTCIHLASYGVKYTDKDIETIADVNIKLACKIMQFCGRNGCKTFLTAGSGFEYGSQALERIKETAILNPEDVYAASKVASETMLNVLAKLLGIKFLIGRPFSIYGRYEPEHRLLPLIYATAKSGQEIKMTAGMQIRDYLYVKDVVNGFYEIIANNQNFESGEAINICSGIGCTLRDFIYSIVDVNGFDRKLFQLGALNYRKNESMYFIGDNTKLISKTSWKQEYPFDRGIADYNSWLSDKQNCMYHL